MKRIFFFLFLGIGTSAYAQEKIVSLRFNPMYHSLPVQMGKQYQYKNDSITITTLKFYISVIQFYQDNKLVGAITKKYHLIDIETPASLTINHPIKKYIKFNRIHFSIGVDSITNVSGAFGGDLDPTNGMYWTWQSGYINFKLEGNSRLCPSRKNQFVFHIGGYQHPNNTLQQLDLKTCHETNIVIDINISQLLLQIELDKLYEIMSPTEKAVAMAEKIKTVFSIAQ